MTGAQPRIPLCGNPRCNGWIGVDEEHRPIPCLECREDLAPGKTLRVNDCDPSSRYNRR